MAAKDFNRSEVLSPLFCAVAQDFPVGTVAFDPVFDSEDDLVIRKNGAKITFKERIENYAWIELELLNPNPNTIVFSVENRKDQLGVSPGSEFGVITLYSGRVVTYRITDIDFIDEIRLFSGGMLDTDIAILRSIKVVAKNPNLVETNNLAIVGPNGGAMPAGWAYNANKGEFSKLIDAGEHAIFSALYALIGDDNDCATIEFETNGVVGIDSTGIDSQAHSINSKRFKYYIFDDSLNASPVAFDLYGTTFPATVFVRFRYGSFAAAGMSAFGASAQSGVIPPTVIPPTSNILNSTNTWNGLNKFVGGIALPGNPITWFLQINGVNGEVGTVGLGDMAYQNYNTVNIIGGSISVFTLTCTGTFKTASVDTTTAAPLNLKSNTGKSAEIQDPGALPVNFLTLKGSATGVTSKLGVAGTDGNIGLDFSSKGTGDITFYSAGFANPQFRVTGTPVSINFLETVGSVTTVPVALRATGTDALISLQLSSKGNGAVSLMSGQSARTLCLFQNTPSSVNYLIIQPNIAGNSPSVYVDGTDTNIGLTFSTKGTGNFSFSTVGGVQFQITHIASATNFWSVEGGASGPPIFRAIGADTNISPQFLSKGSGNLDFLTAGAGAVRFFTGAGSVQAVITHTASANRNLIFSGGNSANVSISATAGARVNVLVGISFAQGAAVASANNLTLGTDGNRFQISGVTQINLLDNTLWSGGGVAMLHFQGGVTVKHNQAASGNFKPIMLVGSVDFVATANDQLTLQYDSTDAKWYEMGRSVI